MSPAPDLGIRERDPDAKSERIGQEEHEEGRGRQHEPGAQPVAVCLEAVPIRDLAHLRPCVGRAPLERGMLLGLTAAGQR